MPTITLHNTQPVSHNITNVGQVIEISSLVPSSNYEVLISIDTFNPSSASWSGTNVLSNTKRVYLFSGAPMSYGIGDTITFQQIINKADLEPIDITVVFS